MRFDRQEYKNAIDKESAARTEKVEAQLVNFEPDPETDGRFLLDLKLLGACDESSLEDGRVVQEGGVGFSGDIVTIDATLEQVVVDADAGRVPQRDARVYLCPPDFLEVLRKFAEENLKEGAPLADARFEGLAEELSKTADPGFPVVPSVGLREMQQKAINAAASRSFSFVWGPPGTGKSFTLGHVADYFRGKGKRVLLLSNTNAAVDVMTFAVDDACARARSPLRECELIRYTRVLTQAEEYERRPHLMAFTKRLNMYLAEERKLKAKALGLQREQAKLLDAGLEPESKPVSDLSLEIALIKDCLDSIGVARKNEISRLVAGSRILASTLTSAMYNGFVSSGAFDVILVDEASLLPLAVWPYLLHNFGGHARPKFVIAGDPLQLKPVGTKTCWEADCQRWFGKSLYGDLGMDDYDGIAPFLEKGSVVLLNEQSRMRKEICAAVSGMFYNGLLSGDRPQEPEMWKSESGLVSSPIVLLNVSQGQSAPGPLVRTPRVNLSSAEMVKSLVKRMMAGWCGERPLDVLVIAAYRNQVLKVYKPMLKALEYGGKVNLRASTIHRCQGSEADIVIFDTVEALSWFVNRSPDAPHLWCVACSRAKRQLYIVGDEYGLRHGNYSGKMFGYVPKTTNA
jgi:hypothetical protein